MAEGIIHFAKAVDVEQGYNNTTMAGCTVLFQGTDFTLQIGAIWQAGQRIKIGQLSQGLVAVADVLHEAVE